LTVLASLVVAAAVGWAALRIAGELRAERDEASRSRSMLLLQLFAPGLGAVQADPRALLVWQPLAKTARQLFPAEFATLDRAAGATFPFTAEQLQAAHAQWTAEWLAWEYAHDAEYKLKAAMVEHEIDVHEASPFLRSKLDAVEREKLGLYQRRYQEYVRVAKALQALSA
jgi:hypothetical protein